MSLTQKPPVILSDTAAIGLLIRQTRKQQGLTLEMLAGVCGLSLRFLSELENGRGTCGMERIFRVLDTLGIELLAQPPQGMKQ